MEKRNMTSREILRSIAEKQTDCENNQGDFDYKYLNGFPIAMAYVPLQHWCETYEAEGGFSNGTLFPALNLPFLGYSK